MNLPAAPKVHAERSEVVNAERSEVSEKVHKSDMKKRKKFVAGVQLIILCQLLVIDLAIWWFEINSSSTLWNVVADEWTWVDVRGTYNVESWQREGHPIALAIAIGLVLLIMVLMYICSDSVARLWPLNLLLLILFTLATAYLLVALIATSATSPLIADTAILITIIFFVQVVYSWIPCLGYSFWMSCILATICAAGVAVWLILPHPDAYLFQWDIRITWILPGDNNDRDQAVHAVTFWITLLATLIFIYLCQYQLWALTYKVEPNQIVDSAFLLYVSIMVTFVFSLQAIASAPSLLRRLR